MFEGDKMTELTCGIKLEYANALLQVLGHCTALGQYPALTNALLLCCSLTTTGL